jgi:hypothetical protein
MLRTLGLLLWLIPLPVALFSPLAGRAEWRFWMILPFCACWVVLRLVATEGTFNRLMVLHKVKERDRTSRRWSPYLSSLPVIGVVWLLARPIAAGLDAGGWVAAILVAAAVLFGLGARSRFPSPSSSSVPI